MKPKVYYVETKIMKNDLLNWKKSSGCARSWRPGLITTCTGWLSTCKRSRQNMGVAWCPCQRKRVAARLNHDHPSRHGTGDWTDKAMTALVIAP